MYSMACKHIQGVVLLASGLRGAARWQCYFIESICRRKVVGKEDHVVEKCVSEDKPGKRFEIEVKMIPRALGSLLLEAFPG